MSPSCLPFKSPCPLLQVMHSYFPRYNSPPPRSAYLPSAHNTALSTYEFVVGDTAHLTFPSALSEVNGCRRFKTIPIYDITTVIRTFGTVQSKWASTVQFRTIHYMELLWKSLFSFTSFPLSFFWPTLHLIWFNLAVIFLAWKCVRSPLTFSCICLSFICFPFFYFFSCYLWLG